MQQHPTGQWWFDGATAHVVTILHRAFPKHTDSSSRACNSSSSLCLARRMRSARACWVSDTELPGT